MGKFYKLFFSLILVSLLASCTQSIRTNVSRFHQLPQPNGEKIAIVPMDPSFNGSLEFANYAALVGNELGRFGYVPANGEEPDLIVELEFGVDDGRQVTRVSPSMIGYGYYGGFYGAPYGRFYRPWYGYHRPFMYGGGFYHPAYWDPFGYYPLGMGPSVRTYTNFTRHLKMVIKPNQDGALNLYEGEVKSVGRNNNLHEVMPYMVQAFFTNFPGESGGSERISVEIPKS